MPAAGTSQDSTPVGRLSDTARARAAVAGICDPEIPVLTIEDLGMLRGVRVDDHGQAVVTITPTYSGCPAMFVMETDILCALDAAGFADARVETVLSPAWTTDWLSDAGREKLQAYGIAPPVRASTSRRALFGEDSVNCPQCGSAETERVSEFGSTSCKALYRCRSCAEPFDYFKCL
jgi:ring-1,2-phenylacetyl-CoA epoxidase subunit PaaD